MFWQKNNKTEKKIVQINEVIKRSFANVKKDTTNIFQWLNYFYKKSAEQEQMVKQLQIELSYAPKTREEIRRIIDDYYSFDSIVARIRELNVKVEELASKQRDTHLPYATIAAPPIQTNISSIEKRLEQLEQKKLSIKEKIMKRLTRNSKEYIKSIIISYIRKYERISAPQLKEMIVDEQNICSKSSFYRLLDEIEQLEDVGVAKYGKKKHLFSKAVKRI